MTVCTPMAEIQTASLILVSSTMWAGGAPNWWPALKTHVVTDLVCPRAILHKRRLVHMARDYDVGAVLADPLLKIGVLERSALRPADRGIEWWRMVDPDPAHALAASGIRFELRNQRLADHWSVPPGAYREKRVVDNDIVAIDEDIQCPEVLDPAGDLLAGVARGVGVMIA